MATNKKKKSFKEVSKEVNTELEVVRQVVWNAELVASFLRNLADQAAADPGVHSEIVKSATLVRLFLENQAKTAREKYPTAFVTEVPNEGTP